MTRAAPVKKPPPRMPPRDVIFAELRRLRHDRVGQGTRRSHETFMHVYASESGNVPRLPAEIVLQRAGDGDLRCVDSTGGLVQARPLHATRFRFTGEIQERQIAFSGRSGSVRVAIYEQVPGAWD